MGWRDSEKRIFLSKIYELKKRRDYPRMEEEVQTALDRHPGDLRFKELLAEANWALGRRSQAAALLREIEEKAVQRDSFQSLKGTMQLAAGKSEAALESFRAAYALRSQPFYLKRQADCLLQLKRFEDAWALLRRLPDQDDPYCLGASARALEGMGRIEEARRLYQKILDRTPGDNFARSRLLRLSVKSRDESDPVAEVDRMLRLPSRRNDKALLKLKADQLRERSRFEEAAEVYEKLALLTSGKERVFFRRQLAFSCYKARLDDKAYPLLLELVEAEPRDAYLRSTLIGLAKRRGSVSEVAGFLAGLARKASSNAFLWGIVKKLHKA